MSIVDDIKGVKSLWSGASLPFKGLIVVSTFFAVSSITSLSDVIFEWKGFILDGIEFYRGLIVRPLQEFAAQFGLSYARQAVDFFILFCIVSSGWLRFRVATAIGRQWNIPV